MADVVYDAIIGATTLRQIMAGGFDAGANVIAGRSSGAIDPTELYGSQSEPKATLETADLASLIGGVSLTAGLAVAAGTVTLPFQKRAQAGAFQGTLSHPAISAANGLLVIDSITSAQDQEAVTAACTFHFRSADGTDPVVGSTGLSLASQDFTAQFGHGPASVNGSAVGEVVGWSVNPGITVRAKRYSGFVFPTSLFIVSRNPTIDLTFEDLDDAMSFVNSFTTMTSLSVFARRRDDGGTFVADASLVHAKFSFTDGIITPDGISLSGVNEGQATVRCTGLALTGSVASAIS